MRAATTILCLALAAPALAADGPYKFKLLIGGGYEPTALDFSQTLTESQYQESASVTTSYTADKVPGVDIGLQWNAGRHVGVQIAGTRYDRDVTGTFSASFPHPLYYNQPRAAAGSVTGKLTETAGHLSLVAFGHSGSLDVSGWAGVSFFDVKADLLEGVTVAQSYPYDSVTVTAAPVGSVSDSAVGFNVGASLDWRFAKSVGVGVQGRFAQAKAKLAVPNGDPLEVNVGGFALGAGLRLYF